MQLIVSSFEIFVNNESTSNDTSSLSSSKGGIECNIFGNFAYHRWNIGFYTKLSHNPTLLMVRSGVKTPPPPHFKNKPPFWVTPPFLKITEPPPPPPRFQHKIFK